MHERAGYERLTAKWQSPCLDLARRGARIDNGLRRIDAGFDEARR